MREESREESRGEAEGSFVAREAAGALGAPLGPRSREGAGVVVATEPRLRREAAFREGAAPDRRLLALEEREGVAAGTWMEAKKLQRWDPSISSSGPGCGDSGARF